MVLFLGWSYFGGGLKWGFNVCMLFRGTCISTVESLLKDHWPYKWGLSRQMVFDDRFSYCKFFNFRGD